MRKGLFVIAVALMIVSVGAALGEYGAGGWRPDTEIDASEPLTLDQCIDIALKQSPGMRIADLNLIGAKLDVADARADYWPSVGVSGQYRFSDDIDFGWKRQNYDAQITANYTIWDHGRREAGLAQAKTNQLAVRSDYDRAKEDLIYNIARAYYDLLQAEKLIDVNEKLLDISRGNVDKVRAFLAADKAIPADVAAAKVQQASNELALVNAENNLELARADLASLMGLDPRTPIKIVDVEEIPSSPEMQEISLEDAITKAVQNRPELKKLRARLTSLGWSLKLAQLDRWPAISAEYDYTVFLDDYLRDREDFNKHRNWSAAVRVSFPIFDGGVSKRREQNAGIVVQQTKEDMGDRERSIMFEVQQAYLSLERSGKSLDIAREQVKDATESLNVTQGLYEENMVILLELLSAQARYAQALINQVTAFYDHKLAEKALLKAMGSLKVKE